MSTNIPYGKTVKQYTLKLWEYFLQPHLEGLAMLCAQGALGTIARFEGAARDREGQAYRFRWDADSGLHIEKDAERREDAGAIVFHGQIDWATRNHLQNFMLFHMRGFYKERISHPACWRIPLKKGQD